MICIWFWIGIRCVLRSSLSWRLRVSDTKFAHLIALQKLPVARIAFMFGCFNLNGLRLANHRRLIKNGLPVFAAFCPIRSRLNFDRSRSLISYDRVFLICRDYFEVAENEFNVRRKRAARCERFGFVRHLHRTVRLITDGHEIFGKHIF